MSNDQRLTVTASPAAAAASRIAFTPAMSFALIGLARPVVAL
jgi:hypothetical protein